MLQAEGVNSIKINLSVDAIQSIFRTYPSGTFFHTFYLSKWAVVSENYKILERTFKKKNC